MDYDHHILYHLKSPLCNEMMAFYFQFLKFDNSSAIVYLNDSLLKVSIKTQHILYQTSRYPHKNCPCLSIKMDYLLCNYHIVVNYSNLINGYGNEPNGI
jgi:hypothetical protein